MPLMIYVFSDGVDRVQRHDRQLGRRPRQGRVDGRQSAHRRHAASWSTTQTAKPTAISNQIGSYNEDGTVNTTSSPGANAVNLLAETVVLNYMALHGQAGAFQTLQWASGLGTGLGSASAYDALIALAPIR